VLDLEGGGCGGFYRVRNRGKQVNRDAIINRGEKFQVIADLVEVKHGTLKPGSDLGTIIVADFHFVPKRSRRYKGAIIKFTFTSDDPQVEVSVERIAPHDCWTKHPTIRDDSFSWTLKPAVDAPGIGEISFGEICSSETRIKTFHTMVDGTIRLEIRDSGGKDTAQWVLGENEAQSTGIARSLRVAMVVKLAISPGRITTSLPNFSATVEAVADVPFCSQGWIEEQVETMKNKSPMDEPVNFQHGVDLESDLFKFSKTKLLDEDLTKVMAMDLYNRFEDLNKAVQEIA
jgi:hypothetical protein